MSDKRDQLDAAVAAFLARGGTIEKPESRQIRAKAVIGSNRGGVRYRYVEKPPSLNGLCTKGERKPPRQFA